MRVGTKVGKVFASGGRFHSKWGLGCGQAASCAVSIQCEMDVERECGNCLIGFVVFDLQAKSGDATKLPTSSVDQDAFSARNDCKH